MTRCNFTFTKCAIRSLILLASAGIVCAADWKPINPEELALKTPKIDKNADAEAIFWEAKVYDRVLGGRDADHAVENYVRVKIYNDRGVKAQSTIDLLYTSLGDETISDVRARTIKPDGTIIDMKSDAVFDKTDVKIGKRNKVKTKSFTLPGVEPGAIIEYQWRQVYYKFLPRYVKLDFQRDIPTWRITYLVKPLTADDSEYKMRYYEFNCRIKPWELTKTQDKYFTTTVFNVPAYLEEPDSPPDDEVKAWVLLFYTTDTDSDIKKYWVKKGKRMNDEQRRGIKVTGEIKALAAQVTQGTETPADKANAIANYCRSKIKNMVSEANGLTAEERSGFKPKEFQNTADTAKMGIGYPSEITDLFAAMTMAAGLETRFVRAGSALTAWFRQDLLDDYLLRNTLVAVKIDDKWKIYDVSYPYITPGMVDWDAEGMSAVMLDDKAPVMMQVPYSTPAQSMLERHATVSLDEDGSVEGHVTVTATGHLGAQQKRQWERLSDAGRQEDLKKDLKATYGELTVSNLKIENVTDPMKPLVYSYDIKVASYAQRTGKRLFFQPSYFTHNEANRFVNATRKFSISFRYPYTERDVVTVKLPEGFALESPSSPGDLPLATSGHHNIKLTRLAGGKAVQLDRELEWGANGAVFYPATSYEPLKQAWDLIHQRDEHTLTLRQTQN